MSAFVTTVDFHFVLQFANRMRYIKAKSVHYLLNVVFGSVVISNHIFKRTILFTKYLCFMILMLEVILFRVCIYVLHISLQVILILRMLLIQKNNPVKWKSINQLMDHKEDRYNTVQFLKDWNRCHVLQLGSGRILVQLFSPWIS